MITVLLLAISINPTVGHPVAENVDRIELNHLYNGDGRLILDQVIWWDWNYSQDRFDVVDWRLVKNCRIIEPDRKREWDTQHPDGPPYVPRAVSTHCCPRVGIDNRNPVCDWFDEKTRRNRCISAKTYIETWTLIDPELQAREDLPQQERRGLMR